MPILFVLFLASLAFTQERSGASWAGLPFANYSADNGTGYGLVGAVFNYGPDGPGCHPYKARVLLQLYQTTRQYRNHYLEVDFPGLWGTTFRWTGKLAWESWQHAFYFGRGGYLPIYREWPDENYYEYQMDGVPLQSSLRVPLMGRLELLGTYRFRLARPSVYDDSLMEEDQPTGIEGGVFSQVGLGLTWDSRDREPSPTTGVYSEFSGYLSCRWTGSSWTQAGFNFTDRRFTSLDSQGNLVLANRFVLDYRSGDPPFFEDWVLGGSQYLLVGGYLLLRGLPAGRYRGDLFIVAQPELRWTALRSHLGPNSLDLMLVPFLDLVKVGLEQPDPPDRWYHLHYTLGGGIRAAWNESFLVRLDVGLGLEEYVSSGVDPRYAITGDPVERAAVVGAYLVFDHPY